MIFLMSKALKTSWDSIIIFSFSLRGRPVKSLLLHVAVFVRMEILDISILESMRGWDEKQMSRSFAC